MIYKDDLVPALKAQSGRKFLQEVRSNIVQQMISGKVTTQITADDVLKPFEVRTVSIGQIVRYAARGSIFEAIFSNWFRPRRKLRPDKVERQPVTVVSKEEKCELVIQVFRAFNVPLRKTPIDRQASEVRNDIFDSLTSSPYVHLFKSISKRIRNEPETLMVRILNGTKQFRSTLNLQAKTFPRKISA